MYFLIGYKGNREDFYGEGCYNRYNSEFHFEEYTTREKLIEGLAKLLVDDFEDIRIIFGTKPSVQIEDDIYVQAIDASNLIIVENERLRCLENIRKVEQKEENIRQANLREFNRLKGVLGL